MCYSTRRACFQKKWHRLTAVPLHVQIDIVPHCQHGVLCADRYSFTFEDMKVFSSAAWSHQLVVKAHAVNNLLDFEFVSWMYTPSDGANFSRRVLLHFTRLCSTSQ